MDYDFDQVMGDGEAREAWSVAVHGGHVTKSLIQLNNNKYVK